MEGTQRTKAPKKRQLTLELGPLVLGAVRREADKMKMPAKDWLEAMLTAAMLHPQGIPLKLQQGPVEPAPNEEEEGPMLPLGGG